MTQEITQLKEKFLKKFPTNVAYYTKENIHEYELPNPIQNRLIQIAEEAVAFQLTYPKSDWTDTTNPSSIEKWNIFVSNMVEYARIPSENLDDALDFAIKDVITILSKPRSFIPELVYGDSETLDSYTLLLRLKEIVVYPYFSDFFQKYIAKKKPEFITKTRFSEILSSVDEKLTANYRYIDWATLLAPAFEIFNNAIPSSFFERFFSDKALTEISVKFSGLSTMLNQDQFIEILAIEAIFEPQEETKIETESPIESGEIETHEIHDNEISEKEKDDNANENISTEIIDEDIIYEDNEALSSNNDDLKLSNDSVSTEEDSIIEDQEEQTYAEPLILADTEEVIDESEILDKNNEENIPLYKLHSITSEDDENDTTDLIEENQSSNLREEEIANDDDEQPMWKMFSNVDISDDLAESTAESLNDDTPIRLDQVEEDTSTELLLRHLSSMRKNYVRELFAKDDSAYEQAIHHIAQFMTWREAGKYLTNEVFKRNTVDMYGNTAIEFTDQLHKFFIDREQKSK